MEKNIWMGTSVERDDVKHRIDLLRECDEKIKFLSIEPLVGKINNIDLTDIDWVIVGGESGPGARPLKKEWVAEIKNACKQADVPFFSNSGENLNSMLMKLIRLNLRIIHIMPKVAAS